jgi:hypothetical protein
VVAIHEGGTGGFSSYIAVEKGNGPSGGRAVVILCDTAVHSMGGLSDLGLHLLHPTHPLSKPRKPAVPSAALLESLTGDYRLANGLGMKVTTEAGALFVQAEGQSKIEMSFDSQGDFYPRTFDAALTPIAAAGGGRTFSWSQGGGHEVAKRVSPAPRLQERDAGATGATNATSTPPASRGAPVADYVGAYELFPGFVLVVTGEAGRLTVQGTHQPRVLAEAAGKDVFVVESVGAELTFERGARGEVDAVTLRQAGNILRGPRKK